MEKKFCHLIVGFSIADYFKNLLLSTLDLDNESDIIVITTGNPLLFGWGVVDYEFNESKKIENLVNHYKKKYKRENIYYYNLEVSKKKKRRSKVWSILFSI